MSDRGRVAAAKEIGERIRWARELVYPNRAEFARILGVDRSTIRDIESGRRPPSIFSVIEISHHLRISAGYILEGKLQDVDGELAGKLAIRHPELVRDVAFVRTPDTDSAASTPRQPRKRDRPCG
jgi:transcriptional regulator with XRE-family HTH domain